MNVRQFTVTLFIAFFINMFLSCANKYSSDPNKDLLEKIKQHKKNAPYKALALSDTLINAAKKIKDTISISEGYLQKGLITMHLGDYEKAVTIFNAQLKSLNNEKYSKMKCRYFIGIGNAYILHGENLNAMQFYEKAAKISQQKKYKDLFYISQVNLAKVKRNIGDRKEALKVYKEYYARAKELNIDKDRKARILMGIGGTFLTLNKPDSALYYSKIGLKISTELKDDILNSYFYHDMGIAYVQKREYIEALRNLNKSKEYIESIQNNERLAESLFYFGKSHYGLENYALAAEHFEKVILLVDTSEKIDNLEFRPQELLSTYELLVECYRKLGKDEELIELVESNKNNLGKEINKNNNEVKITLYRKQNETLANVLKQKNQETKLQKGLIIIAFSLLFLALLALFYYKNKSKNNKKKFDALMQKQEQVNKVEKSVSNQININDARVAEILKRLDKIEKQEYYLESNCTLANMAKKLKTNTTYLTKILKEQKQKTFYQYLNELRINYAIKRLHEDKKFRKYSIRHIAQEVGYKSPESFAKHFKKTTEINPSYYIKEIEKRSAASKL